ncbi:quinone-dependent dihydroorotate dehydrogenase [Patescibacteria group bacterium]|nr:quinone-dependent dihydroorotate dehydrogenase [Patescibacteria group bacterium]
MLTPQLEKALYKNLAKPVFFLFDAELIHNLFTDFGELLENAGPVVQTLFAYQNPALKRKVLGLEFPNPIGLAAGFDYDGHLAKVIADTGFGFNTVGTVTAKAYPGNPPPRLARLPKSGSLLVNKGFKSSGAAVVARRLDKKKLDGQILGISVGSSNLPEINTIPKAIEDYLFTFNVFKNKPYVKYFELNISCPNTAMSESFTNPKNFQKLLVAVKTLKIRQPIFIKMPNEITVVESDKLVQIALKLGIRGFIFSNLVKRRDNPILNSEEVTKYQNHKGSFSGKPVAANAKNLVAHTRQKFGESVALISTGGIFTPEDALERLDSGANLVQLITGMIYEGPQLVGSINAFIVRAKQEL